MWLSMTMIKSKLSYAKKRLTKEHRKNTGVSSRGATGVQAPPASVLASSQIRWWNPVLPGRCNDARTDPGFRPGFTLSLIAAQQAKKKGAQRITSHNQKSSQVRRLTPSSRETRLSSIRILNSPCIKSSGQNYWISRP